MAQKTGLWIAGGAVIALVAAGGYFLTQPPKTTVAVAGDFAVPATPAGITIQRVGETLDSGISALLPRDVRKLAYGDPKGMVLYTYDKDTEAGKSACVGDCAKNWLAATAPAAAKASGDWSVIAREDGSKQWAYRGKPVYTSSLDAPGEAKALGGGPGGGRRNRGAPEAAATPAPAVDTVGWHVASFEPASDVKLPFGMVDIREVADANGQSLVDDRGMTLYDFDGDPAHDKQTCAANASCTSHWSPFAAPEAITPVGDFSFIERADGIRQWAYKGRALYRFDGDLETGDAAGIGVDPHYSIALVKQYYLPPNVSLVHNASRGVILADAQGMTLYRRDGYTYQVSGHGLRRALPTRPLAGREFGTKTCDAECAKVWHPLVAAADAQPSGYWEVAVRADGVRQWVYQGYAMYTYAGDKKAGEMTGNDIYEYMFSEDPTKVAQIPARMQGAGALYWTYTNP